MSARNTQTAKARRRLERSVPPNREETKIDLIEYIKLRTNCTTGTARKVLLAGSLKVGSHPVGYKQWPDGRRTVQRYIPARHRSEILVTMPSFLR